MVLQGLPLLPVGIVHNLGALPGQFLHYIRPPRCKAHIRSVEKVIHLGVRKQILAQPSVKGHNGPIGGKREHGTEDHRLPVAVIKIVQVLHLVLLQQGLRRFAEQALTQKGAVPHRDAHISQPHRGHAGTPAQGHGEPIRIKLLPRSRELGHAGENTVNVAHLGLGKTVKVGELSYEGLELLNAKDAVVCAVKLTRAARGAAAAAGK